MRNTVDINPISHKEWLIYFKKLQEVPIEEVTGTLLLRKQPPNSYWMSCSDVKVCCLNLNHIACSQSPE
jgi:hypothetical protein